MSTKILHGLASIGIAAALGVVPAFAEGKAGHKTQAMKGVDSTDFALRAAQDGVTEVKLGQLAAERGSDEKIKEFGRHMVKDHSAANDKLQAIAKDKNLQLPQAPSEEQQKVCDKLEALSGPAFDRAYAREMVKAHEKAVALFETQSKRGNDSMVKNFAANTLPTLQEHLSEVRKIAAPGRAQHTAKSKMDHTQTK